MGYSEGLGQLATEEVVTEGRETANLPDEPDAFGRTAAEGQATPFGLDDYAEGDIGHAKIDTRSVRPASEKFIRLRKITVTRPCAGQQFGSIFANYYQFRTIPSNSSPTSDAAVWKKIASSIFATAFAR